MIELTNLVKAAFSRVNITVGRFSYLTEERCKNDQGSDGDHCSLVEVVDREEERRVRDDQDQSRRDKAVQKVEVVQRL